MVEKRETWKTHIGMMMAMIGTEVGLGNVWRFPYLCGKYGGGSFLVPYITLLLGVAVFGMMAEWVVGRHTRREPMGAFQKIGFPWGRDVGSWGVIGPFFLYSYYIVITAWVLFFIVASAAGLYFGGETPEHFVKYFLWFLGSPWVFLVHAVAVAFTSLVLSFGVQRGIERACKVMIPALFVLLIAVAIRSVTLEGAAEGIEFYMRPRWEGIANPEAWLAALGQVFFTLSLGMGAMIIYGSYMKKSWGIPLNAISCSLGNTSASILAGFAIFPAAFALGFGPDVGGEDAIGLTFTVLPRVFDKMPLGQVFGGLFFVLLAFGALSSAISIQEPSIAWMKDELRWPRKKSALITGVVLWLMGLPFVLNGFVRHGANGAPAGIGEKLALLGKMDSIINNLGLPLFALMAILAVGWVMRKKGFDELNLNARFKLGRWVRPWMRYVVPAVFVFIFLVNLIRIVYPPLMEKLLGKPYPRVEAVTAAGLVDEDGGEVGVIPQGGRASLVESRYELGYTTSDGDRIEGWAPAEGFSEVSPADDGPAIVEAQADTPIVNEAGEASGTIPKGGQAAVLETRHLLRYRPAGEKRIEGWASAEQFEEVPSFVSIGITPVTVVTIIVVCGIVWGGAIGGFLTVVAIERRKQRDAAAAGAAQGGRD